ncbi:PREDICTED: uncharacterized protein LOC105448351, partial [Wasmannia auropunctata]|uniref:uncharacterized protein LOC105448351 n=1 Tax=Wasmannia auropunctata TaxID=64793 RepID=UPI0005EE5BD4
MDFMTHRCQVLEATALSASRRISEIRSRKICTNCLRSTTHTASKCPSGNCKTCKGKHSTLLHATTSTDLSAPLGKEVPESRRLKEKNMLVRELAKVSLGKF